MDRTKYKRPDIASLLVYEDSQIIVCHKPAGIATQTSHVGSFDLVSLLKNYLAASSRSGTKPASGPSAPYLAVIHRLDQPVEGLLVFAKTPAAARELNRQLATSGFGKYYRALVNGIPSPLEGTLEDYLVSDGRANITRVCKKDTPGAKFARLSYKVIESRDGLSLVDIVLDTGRRHQIRVQMAHLGCPLAGDRKYGVCEPADRENAEPLRLCAYKLTFYHPKDKRKMCFELNISELPGWDVL